MKTGGLRKAYLSGKLGKKAAMDKMQYRKRGRKVNDGTVNIIKLLKLIPSIESEDTEWMIMRNGVDQYAFAISQQFYIFPDSELTALPVPNNTPEIIECYQVSEKQNLLNKVHYNHLIDVFLGMVAYSLESNIKLQLQTMGQVEIDELYLGVNCNGEKFIIPVVARGIADTISVAQVIQNIYFCQLKYPTLTCIPVAVQIMSDAKIAMMRLTCKSFDVQTIEEKHYKLVKR